MYFDEAIRDGQFAAQAAHSMTAQKPDFDASRHLVVFLFCFSLLCVYFFFFAGGATIWNDSGVVQLCRQRGNGSPHGLGKKSGAAAAFVSRRSRSVRFISRAAYLKTTTLQRVRLRRACAQSGNEREALIRSPTDPLRTLSVHHWAALVRAEVTETGKTELH